MVSPRIDLIYSCEGCSARRYGSGDVWECSLAGNQPIPDIKTIAAFCPKPTFPAETIANLERTITAMREGVAGDLISMIFAHLASRLCTVIGRQYEIAIKYKVGDSVASVNLEPRSVEQIILLEHKLIFRHEGREYQLLFPNDAIELWVENGEETFTHHKVIIE